MGDDDCVDYMLSEGVQWRWIKGGRTETKVWVCAASSCEDDGCVSRSLRWWRWWATICGLGRWGDVGD